MVKRAFLDVDYGICVRDNTAKTRLKLRVCLHDRFLFKETYILMYFPVPKLAFSCNNDKINQFPIKECCVGKFIVRN